MPRFLPAVALCAAIALLAAGCSDSDPKRPQPPTTTVDLAITDLVGDWDNLHLVGDLTGGEPVALTRDGPFWSAQVADLGAGTYEFGLYHEDGTEAGAGKTLQLVRDELLITIGEDLAVAGDIDITLEPGPDTGFILLAVNHDPAYDNIRIRGAMNSWTPGITDRSADGVHSYLHVAAGQEADSYQWQVLGDEGEQLDVVLSPTAPNLEFAIAVDGSLSGDTAFTIPAPAESRVR